MNTVRNDREWADAGRHDVDIELIEEVEEAVEDE